MDSYAFLLIPIDLYGFLGISVDSDSYDSYGFVWIPKDLYGTYGFLKNIWIPKGSIRKPTSSTYLQAKKQIVALNYCTLAR